jgi:hypothetical protein
MPKRYATLQQLLLTTQSTGMVNVAHHLFAGDWQGDEELLEHAPGRSCYFQSGRASMERRGKP